MKRLLNSSVGYWFQLVSMLQLFLLSFASKKVSITLADVGASAISKPIIFRAFHSTALYAFDPDPRAASDFENLPFEVFFHPVAIADKVGKHNLYLTKKSHCSSLLKPIDGSDERYQLKDVIQIDCNTLDNLGVYANIIKLDVQGAEMEIIRSSPKAVNYADAVAMEVCFSRLYEGQSDLSDLIETMNSHNYNFIGFTKLYEESNNQTFNLAFSDVLFVKQKNEQKSWQIIMSSLIENCLERRARSIIDINRIGIFNSIIVKAIIILSLCKYQAPMRVPNV